KIDSKNLSNSVKQIRWNCHRVNYGVSILTVLAYKGGRRRVDTQHGGIPQPPSTGSHTVANTHQPNVCVQSDPTSRNDFIMKFGERPLHGNPMTNQGRVALTVID